MEKLLAKYRSAAVSIAVVVGAVVLSLVVGKFLLDKVNVVRSEIADVGAKSGVLQERLDALQAAAPQIESAVNVASVAVPEDNPSVLIVQQLKRASQENSIEISNISVISLPSLSQGTGDGSDVQLYQVDFDVSGQYKAIASFLTSLSKITPLMNLETVYLRAKPLQDLANGQVKLYAYSAPYPTKLPGLTEPLNGLSDAEKETINTLRSFSAPQTTSVNPEDLQVPSGGKADPFSQ